MTVVMFDTNFFRKFVEDTKFFHKVKNHLERKYQNGAVSMFVSPFCFLEYAGIVIPTPAEPVVLKTAKGKSFTEMFEIAEKAYYEAFEFFKTKSNITTERILMELDSRKKYVHPDGRKYWEIATKRYSDPANLSIIHHLLACDFLQKIPLKKTVAEYYHPSLWMDAARRIAAGSDVCLFRSMQWRWEAEKKHHLILSYGKFRLQQLNTAMGVRFKDDFVDTEIIHYTCFGKVDGGTILPVSTFTCDPVDKIKDRMRVYFQGLDKSIDEINNTVDETGKSWIFKFPAPSPGEITFFDLSGNLLEGPVSAITICT